MDSKSKIEKLKKEIQIEQKKILLKNYDVQILELEDKIVFTKEAKSKIEEELAVTGG